MPLIQDDEPGSTFLTIAKLSSVEAKGSQRHKNEQPSKTKQYATYHGKFVLNDTSRNSIPLFMQVHTKLGSTNIVNKACI